MSLNFNNTPLLPVDVSKMLLDEYSVDPDQMLHSAESDQMLHSAESDLALHCMLRWFIMESVSVQSAQDTG